MGRAPEFGVSGRRRVGIFGGTFDPPHLGHVAVARDVADALALDQVVWMPAGIPPHKAADEITSAGVRLAMVRAAIEGHEDFVVSDLEISRPGLSYTVDTLRELQGAGEDTDHVLILGVDQYRSLDSWRLPEEIRTRARIAVMDRGGESMPPDENSQRVLSVAVRRVDVSSTDVRRRVRDGDDVSGLVPDGVASLIHSQGLYST
ncbi:MAG: nicotinate-nucleotide adenylyltransferase [Gemmatimonadetes bacterium]|nr:nicotinate-nucleotide adenylyltransferase [Gemmatimonadota bacterium]MDA1104597.1 nicotinate-nucleotide adenylyltransferase [Gemmatimonadota bacterium]